MDTIDLSKFCKTRSQATDFAAQMTTIGEKIFETNFNIESAVMQTLGLSKKDAFLKLLHEKNIDPTSREQLKSFLTSISEQATALPVVNLTLAFEPKEETLQVLSEWFMIQNNMQVLFDITVDKNIIAGSIINFKGKHANYAVKSRFETITHDMLTPPPANQQTQQVSPSQTDHQATPSSPPPALPPSPDQLHLGR